MTALHVPTKALRSGAPADDGGPTWDLYLDGALVASAFTSQTAALTALDLAAWRALFGEAALAPDAPITDEALGIALSVFNRLFRAETVQEKARTALEKIITAQIYTVQADGSLRVLASSGRGRRTFYTVKTHAALQTDGPQDADAAHPITLTCECRDFYVRAHAHGGVCKHVAARLLLFLAQRGVASLKHLRDALDRRAPAPIQPTADTSTADASAFLAIAAPDLVAALFLVARAATPVELRADQRTLQLIAGAITLTLPSLDGAGVAALYLEHAALAALYEQIRSVAKSAGALNLFVDPADGVLFVCDQEQSDFSATACGQALPIAAGPLSEPAIEPPHAATPTPLVETPTVAALYELFRLLEQHEPEWYLRRHYRVAHDALCAAGRLAT